MSWLKGLAGKAEDFLNQIDQNAAVVLQPSSENLETGHSLTEVMWDVQEKEIDLPNPSSWPDDPVINCRPSDLDVTLSMNPSSSRCSRLSRTTNGIHAIKSSPNLPSLTPVLLPVQNNDNHLGLIEFVNTSPSSSVDITETTELVSARPLATSQSLGDVKLFRRPVTPLMNEEYQTSCNESTIINSLENTKTLRHNYTIENNPLGTVVSNVKLCKEVDDLKTENQLLHNELRSFNNEMSLLLQRSKAAEKECTTLQQQLKQLEDANNYFNHIIKEKEEKNVLLEDELQLVKQQFCTQDYAQGFQEKIMKLKHDDFIGVSGTQNEELLTCHEHLLKKKNDIEDAKSIYQQELDALNNSVQSLKSDKTFLSHQVHECQRAINEWHEKFNKSQAAVLEVQSELEQYRSRAHRILQDKEQLITELRGERIGGSSIDNVTALELEQLRQEMELVREEAIQVSARLQATQKELSHAEGKFETYKYQMSEAQTQLQEALEEERKLRQAAEEDSKTHSQGLYSVREELTRQCSLLASKLREREAELTKLRSQLLHRPVSPQGDELESRLQALTRTLVQKQTSIETITTERNAIRLQYEKLEIKHREIMALMYRNQGTTNVNDTDDAKAQVPSFLEESPFDTGVARRVKRVYSNLDAVSIRTGVFLRRYPLARILVLCYMVLLHIWVMIVLVTYSPEIHPPTRSSKGSH